MERLRKEGYDDPGSRHITMLQDSFEHGGPNGRHVCLIFQVLGESISTFQKSFPQAQIPSPLAQHFSEQLLRAIDYGAASSIRVCYTASWRSDKIHAEPVADIQPANSMLHNPDETALTKYLEKTYADTYLSAQTSEDYRVIPSRNLRSHYLGNTRGFNLMTLEVRLGDWGVACFADEHLSETIQPPLLRAPEVMLDAPWDTAVDILNLGALIPELMFGQNMFSGADSGAYNVKGHFAEMNALLGSFPPALLSAAKMKGVKDMFDGQGNVRKYRLKKVASLEKRFENLPSVEAAKFETFIRLLLDLNPERRASAGGLLDDLWLSHEYTQSTAAEKVS